MGIVYSNARQICNDDCASNTTTQTQVVSHQHSLDHQSIEDWFAGRTWFAPQAVTFARLKRQSHSLNPIGDEVQPQQLHRQQWHRQTSNHC